MDTHAPSISVVIATRNRPEMLRSCIESVLGSDHPSFEVVVADQSEEPVSLGCDPRIIHLHLTTRGKSAALNAGIAAASAPMLAFTDDDCTVPPDWLTRAEALFTQYPEVSVAYGDLKPIDYDPTAYLVPGASLGRFEIVRGCGAIAQRGGAGANLLARRSAFEVIGAWDELIGPGALFRACEEYDIYYRTLAAGLAIARVPSIEVLHWGARRHDDGSARKLLDDYAYGEGVVIGKHLRLGDVRMIAPAGRMAVRDLLDVITGVVSNRNLDGLRSYLHWVRGLFAGLSSKVDRRARVFASARS
jgi:glycosyltransferase involved in cell wall biosynthesis